MPEFLGGTCTCAENGGCLKSEKGPWKDPNILKVPVYHLVFTNISPRVVSHLWMVFVGIQRVLSGEAQCGRQIVTVSNGEGKIIAYAKPHYPAVRRGSFCLLFYLKLLQFL